MYAMQMTAGVVGGKRWSPLGPCVRPTTGAEHRTNAAPAACEFRTSRTIGMSTTAAAAWLTMSGVRSRDPSR